MKIFRKFKGEGEIEICQIVSLQYSIDPPIGVLVANENQVKNTNA